MEAKKNKSKAAKIVVNVVIGIVIVLILFVAATVIFSRDKNYFSMFGIAPYAVKTDSMQGDNADSFNKGDLIFVKELSPEQKADLKVGDVITFWQIIDNKYELNTHRIINVMHPGTDLQVVTRGDNAPDDKTEYVFYSDIIGTYQSKIPAIGGAILFMQSPTGFLIFVVIPSILIVGYCAYLVMRNYSRYQSEKTQSYRDGIISEVEQVKLAEEKMAEMQRQIEELQRLADTQKQHGGKDKK